MDIKNHTPQCDVFSTTDIAHMPVLKERHELTAFTPDNAAGLMPEFKRVSDDGYYYITERRPLFPDLQQPRRSQRTTRRKAWTDLLDPKWKGRVATGHPAFSGCTGVWALSLKKLYGWEFFEKLAANNPRIGRSAGDPITLLNAGECLVGVGAAGGAYPAEDKGNPIGVNHPTDGLVLCLAPSADPGQCTASECGQAVPGLAAERQLLAPDCPRRQRAVARRRAAASRGAAIADPESHSADSRGDPHGRARSDRAMA